MPVMAVLPLEFIEHQTSQCCEIWWGSGVSRFEHCISYATVKDVFQAGTIVINNINLCQIVEGGAGGKMKRKK